MRPGSPDSGIACPGPSCVPIPSKVRAIRHLHASKGCAAAPAAARCKANLRASNDLGTGPLAKSVPGGHTIGVVGRSHKVQGSLGVQPYVIGRRTALAIDTLSAIQSQVKPGTGSAIPISSRKRAVALPGGWRHWANKGTKAATPRPSAASWRPPARGSPTGTPCPGCRGFPAPSGTRKPKAREAWPAPRLSGARGYAQADHHAAPGEIDAALRMLDVPATPQLAGVEIQGAQRRKAPPSSIRTSPSRAGSSRRQALPRRERRYERPASAPWPETDARTTRRPGWRGHDYRQPGSRRDAQARVKAASTLSRRCCPRRRPPAAHRGRR